MRTHAINIGLGVALLATLGLNWYARRPPSDPNVEFASEMVRAPSYQPFERNPNFPDGLTQRPPVPGTIARGRPPLAYGPTAADAMRAGNELVNPFAADDAAAVERGRVVYSRYCEMCHGADGSGGGPVIEHGFRKPPTLLRPFTRNMKDGQIFHLATYGRGAMPAHGAQIPVNDRWKVVLYVRHLQGVAARAPTAAAGSEDPAYRRAPTGAPVHSPVGRVFRPGDSTRGE